MLNRQLWTLLLLLNVSHIALGQEESCARVDVLSIECDALVVGDYLLTFELTNLSGIDAERVKLIAEDANSDFVADFGFDPDTWIATVPDGGTITLTTQIVGVVGTVACFELWLFDEDFEECCVIEVCIDLPSCPTEPQFIRCDCNRDGFSDIGDAIFMLSLLFFGGVPSCEDACDANDDGVIDIGDAIYKLSSLFGIGPTPPSPFPSCGPDPTSDTLTCDSFPACP